MSETFPDKPNLLDQAVEVMAEVRRESVKGMGRITVEEVEDGRWLAERRAEVAAQLAKFGLPAGDPRIMKAVLVGALLTTDYQLSQPPAIAPRFLREIQARGDDERYRPDVVPALSQIEVLDGMLKDAENRAGHDDPLK